MSTIIICDAHDKEVPLIWTFAFNGAEYWCPYCGKNSGMLGAGIRVEKTPELEKELEEWKKRSSDYLDAESTFVCCELEFEGKRMKPHDLPQSEKDRCRKIIDEWKYDIEKEEA